MIFMPISYSSEKKIFSLHTDRSTYQLAVDRFGTLLLDREQPDEVEEMNIVPAWIDETDDTYGNLVFLDCGETGEDDEANASQTHTGRRPGVEVVDPDVVIQFGAFPSVSNGEQDKSGAVFDKIFVAYWWGDYTRCKPRLPHPWTDTFDMTYSYAVPAVLTDTSKLTITWGGVIYSGRQLSLRINNRAYGQGVQRATYTEVDQKKKYSFSFLSDEIPNVRSLFHIDGKRYLCAKLTATFTEDGMSHLLKGDFYKVQTD